MLNNTETKIVITMKHVDNAIRLHKRLTKFFETAATGGDAELFLKHNGEMKEIGFVAHDLRVSEVEHLIPRNKL